MLRVQLNGNIIALRLLSIGNCCTHCAVAVHVIAGGTGSITLGASGTRNGLGAFLTGVDDLG